jgi:hypothetical protein
VIDSTRVHITEEEAKVLWPKINAFVREQGDSLSMRSDDPQERRMAEALLLLQKQRRSRGRRGELRADEALAVSAGATRHDTRSVAQAAGGQDSNLRPSGYEMSGLQSG